MKYLITPSIFCAVLILLCSCAKAEDTHNVSSEQADFRLVTVADNTHWGSRLLFAPSGMAFYTGEKFPDWKGDLFVGVLAHRHLRRLELGGDRVVAQRIA